MNAIKRILVPTDLSDVAERGLQLAVEIARRTKAELFLINFLHHPLGRTFSAMGEVSSKHDEEAELFNIELLQSNRSKLNLLGLHYSQQGVIINTEIVDDNFKGGVDAYLRKHQIDLVVMGTSGEETIQEHFTGNHTEQVIKISSCPVISIRDSFDASRFNNIVLAIDVMHDNDTDANVYAGIHSLKQLADAFDATIHFVHVVDPSLSMKLDLEVYFTKLAQRFMLRKFDVTILCAEDQVEGMMEYARKINAGFIAVLKNSNQGMFRIFSNHFSDRIVKGTNRPVFTYNLQNA